MNILSFIYMQNYLKNWKKQEILEKCYQDNVKFELDSQAAVFGSQSVMAKYHDVTKIFEDKCKDINAFFQWEFHNPFYFGRWTNATLPDKWCPEKKRYDYLGSCIAFNKRPVFNGYPLHFYSVWAPIPITSNRLFWKHLERRNPEKLFMEFHNLNIFMHFLFLSLVTDLYEVNVVLTSWSLKTIQDLCNSKNIYPEQIFLIINIFNFYIIFAIIKKISRKSSNFEKFGDNFELLNKFHVLIIYMKRKF